MNRSSIKTLLLKILQYSQKKHLRWSLFLNKNVGPSVLKPSQKEASTQVFSCEYWEVFKSTCFGEHL